jgi:hypothetical protein
MYPPDDLAALGAASATTGSTVAASNPVQSNIMIAATFSTLTFHSSFAK